MIVLRTSSGCMPSDAATLPVRPHAPLGARKNGTCAFGSPSAVRMMRRFSTRSARTWSAVMESMGL